MEEHKIIKAWKELTDIEKAKQACEEKIHAMRARQIAAEQNVQTYHGKITELKREAEESISVEHVKRQRLEKEMERVTRLQEDLAETVKARSKKETEVAVAEKAMQNLSSALPVLAAGMRAAEATIPQLEENMVAARAAKNEAVAEATEDLDGLLQTLFVSDNRSLIYPNMPREDLPDPISRLNHTWRENYGYLQMMNNPLYMTDRLFEFVENLRSEALARLSTGAGAPPGVELNNAQLCRIVMHATATTLSDSAFKARLAHLLFVRLEPVKIRLLEESRKPENATLTELHALGRAAEEMVDAYQKDKGGYSTESSTKKVKDEIMAVYNTGKIFDKWVQRYKVGVLAVIPIYELMKLSGTTAIKIIQKGYLRWIQGMILGSDPNAEAAFCERQRLPRFLTKLVDFLSEFVDFDSAQWCLRDGYQHGHFRTKFRALRKDMHLPSMGVVFGLATSANSLADWEMAASISGWDATSISAASITDSAGKIVTISQPSELLSQIWGLRFSTDNEGVQRLVQGSMSTATLEVVIRLLLSEDAIQKMSTQGIRLEFVGKDRVVKIQDTRGGDESVRQLLCLVELEAVWVVLLLVKTPAGSTHMLERFNHAFAFHPNNATGAAQVREALGQLTLGNGDNNLMTEDNVTHVDAPAPHTKNPQRLWDIQAFCHVMALLSCGHHWLRPVDVQLSTDLRHLMLRTASRALIQSHIDNST